MKDFRCPNKLQGRVLDSGLIEVSCDSSFCGKAKGVVVLHRFNPETGDLVETLRYKNPTQTTQETEHGPS